MLYSLADTVDAALLYARPSIVSAKARRDITSLVRGLPDAMSDFGFECRLGAHAPRVDFSTRVAAQGGGRKILAHYEIRGRCANASNTVWERIRQFAARWADPLSPLHEVVSMLFFEFDIDPYESRTPSVFVRLGRDPVPGSAPVHDIMPITDEVFGLLTGAPLLPATRAMLADCLRFMPPGACLSDVAAMLARRTNAIRVFASVPSSQVAEFFRSIGWRARNQSVVDILSRWFHPAEFVDIQFDLAAEVFPRIGLEFSYGADMRRLSQWQELFEWLVEVGLCSREKKEAALAWPGATRELLPGERWPCVLRRSLSHVKLVVEPEGVLEAKAYLWSIPTFSLVC